MKDDQIEPIEPSLGTLFSSERARGQAPPESRERVLGRLAHSIPALGNGGIGGGSNGRATPSTFGTLRRLVPILGAFAVGGLVGGLVVAKAREPRIVYVDRVAQPSASSATASEPEAPAIAFSALPVESAPTTAPATSPPVIQGDHDLALARERAILDVARTALGRNDGAHALGAIERHEREFPRGQMTEEREAIGIQALAKLGRTDEAAVRGARFRKRYPDSVLMPVIDAALPGRL